MSRLRSLKNVSYDQNCEIQSKYGTLLEVMLYRFSLLRYPTKNQHHANNPEGCRVTHTRLRSGQGQLTCHLTCRSSATMSRPPSAG